MHGTVVCAVAEGMENDDAVARAAEVSERLGLRLVLAHVVDAVVVPDYGDDGAGVTARGDRRAAERRLMELARSHGVEGADRRIEVGDPPTLLGQIATEEAADVIVVGVPEKRWGRRRLESKLADGLETETPVPVLIAPRHRPLAD